MYNLYFIVNRFEYFLFFPFCIFDITLVVAKTKPPCVWKFLGIVFLSYIHVLDKYSAGIWHHPRERKIPSGLRWVGRLQLSVAAVFRTHSLVVLFFAGPPTPPVPRLLTPEACLFKGAWSAPWCFWCCYSLLPQRGTQFILLDKKSHRLCSEHLQLGVGLSVSLYADTLLAVLPGQPQSFVHHFLKPTGLPDL